jgi:murein DD-endopeptidase MepM/ murein hydrolase activator NlpD
MKRMRLTTARKAGFSHKVLRRHKELPRQTLGYLKQKSSFLVAAFSLVAFITGNMVGQHGWYAFWKATLGYYDDSLITYNGTVAPIAFVPDYTKWSMYGGNNEEHTYRQVPKDALVPLPSYKQAEQKQNYDDAPDGDVYSIGFMGSYETGAEGDGSHIGVDIRVPEGTPVRSIANGIVERVSDDKSGFGKLIVIRHPHAPDPDHPEYETVLHSGYAHLSAQYVMEGDIVQKGQEIGLSGKTGFATGPHLHFQIDRDEAPWHPYWAFSYSEAAEVKMNTAQAINAGLHKERGYQYTVNPILYVQQNYPAAKFKIEPDKTITKNTVKPAKTVAAPARKVVTAQSRGEARNARKQMRIARQTITNAAAIAAQPIIVKTQTVADTQPVPSSPAPVLVTGLTTTEIASVDIQHAPTYSGRDWINVRLILRDANGQTASEKNLTDKLYMRTAYGDAEFKPETLSAADFKDGVANIQMLPRGQRTIVIQIKPLNVMGRPLEFK